MLQQLKAQLLEKCIFPYFARLKVSPNSGKMTGIMIKVHFQAFTALRFFGIENTLNRLIQSLTHFSDNVFLFFAC